MPSFPNREVRAGTELLAVTLASLWTVDVLTRLGLAQRALSAEPQFVAYFQDYAGLLLAEVQVAVCVVVAAGVVATLLARLLPDSDWRSESGALVAGSVAGLTAIGLTRALGLMFLGALVWAIVRSSLRRGRGPRIRPSAMMAGVLLPSLLIATTSYGLGRLRIGGSLAIVLAAVVLGLVAWAAAALSAESRRRWTLGLLLSVAAGALLLVVQTATPPQPGGIPDRSSPSSQPPDIVLVVLDTVRADHLREYGYSRNTMPALGRWSENAMVATRAVSPAGWTVPAHASIFSGRTVSDHGVHNSAVKANSGVFWTFAYEGIPWLPQVLAERGYRSVAVAANPLAITSDVAGFAQIVTPKRPFWESTIGALGDSYLGFGTGLGERLRWRMPYVDAERITDIAAASLPDEEGPVFLFVNYMDAHSPYNPPRESLELLGIGDEHLFDRYSEHQWLTRSWKDLPAGKERHLADLYDGELRGLDAQLERLLAWIDLRLGDDTIIIVTSDHGEELGESGRVGHEFGLGQELIHVPLFIRMPGFEGQRMDDVVDLRKIYDLIASLASGDSPQPAVLSPPAGEAAVSERYPSALYVRGMGEPYARAWVSMIERDLKVVGPSSFGLQFASVAGPGFRESPVADDQMVRTLQQKIDDYWETAGDKREAESASQALSEQERRRLRALGYIR